MLNKVILSWVSEIMQVKIIASGRQFETYGNESLLDAGVRAGLSLGYGCNNGNCGECKANLIQGQVKKWQHHDYHLADNEILLCSYQACSDLVIETTEAHSVDDIPWQRIQTKVAKLDYIAHYLILYLRTPRSKALRFLAGQDVNLIFLGGGLQGQAIASCPCNGKQLQFHLDLNQNLPFKKLRRSEPVVVEGPMGHFVWEDDYRQSVILLAYKTGFARLKSIIEHLIALDYEQSVSLYWLAESKHDFYLNNYCRMWEDALDNFQFAKINSTDAELLNQIETILQQHHHLNMARLYLVIPKPLKTGCLELLSQYQITPEQIYLETI